MMKLWNGKYLDEEDLVADEFCASIGFDQRLWKEDILCSIAHVKKLAAEGKLTEDECDSIVVHLQEILWDAEAGRLHFTAEDHNIQTAVQKLLTRRIGEIAQKLQLERDPAIHTARALRLYQKEAIQALRKSGIKKTIMLTGDSKRIADQVAADLGIDEVYSELLPGDKVSKVEELLAAKTEKEKLAFVGDGINDAPVLSRADIGIAMGALGSDAAIEAADIVLMDDDPLKISKAIHISRKCIHIVYENIYFAIGIKVLFLLLGAIGIANMWMAIFADVGVMILAVLNAIRALFVKNL